MKHISAIITALVITAVIGLGIVVIGANALTNTNTVPLQNSPNAAGGTLSNTSGNTAAQSASGAPDVQQLEQQLSNLQSQLNQDTQVIQQYQSLLTVLQQRGIIYIDRNGNIYLPEGGSDSFH